METLCDSFDYKIRNSPTKPNDVLMAQLNKKRYGSFLIRRSRVQAQLLLSLLSFCGYVEHGVSNYQDDKKKKGYY